MKSLARLDSEQQRLEPIPGSPPSLLNPPPGCAFHPRCLHSQGRLRCRTEVPPLRTTDEREHLSACHFAEELIGETAPLAAAGGS
jgi:oligopeptide/dipeptide ABC transporter ATP-binding protein